MCINSFLEWGGEERGEKKNRNITPRKYNRVTEKLHKPLNWFHCNGGGGLPEGKKKTVKLVLTTMPEIYILSLILLGQAKGIFGI